MYACFSFQLEDLHLVNVLGKEVLTELNACSTKLAQFL